MLSSVLLAVCRRPCDSGSVFCLRRDSFPRLFILGASSWVNSFCGLLQTLSANLSAFFFDFLGSGCLSDVGCLPVAQCPDKLVHKHRPDRAQTPPAKHLFNTALLGCLVSGGLGSFSLLFLYQYHVLLLSSSRLLGKKKIDVIEDFFFAESSHKPLTNASFTRFLQFWKLLFVIALSIS